MSINIIGGGLAGCEAAYQVAKRGIKVNLYDMKPNKKSPAHHSDKLCELVCSNSLKAARKESAAGMLKEEMRMLDSLLMKCADKSKVPAGGALAVDREIFSNLVNEEINNNPNITVINEEVTEIPDGITIIASGPLTSDLLSDKIKTMFGDSLSFFDAAAPIVKFDTVDMNKAFFASRYDKGDGDDYINCPMNKEEYDNFYEALVSAERAPVHDFDVMNPKVYEGCMPIEVMAQRGHDTIRFGPMKPVGLKDPRTGHRPWAVVQLRKENSAGIMYNLVGFQTNLKFPEQKRVFSMIPGLENAEFVRYGVMHRNTYINSPTLLNKYYQMEKYPKVFFAGQITGVEGYVESASSGILAGYNMAAMLNGKDMFEPDSKTCIGALPLYISNSANTKFQPMNANFGIIDGLNERIRNKAERYNKIANRALDIMKDKLKGENDDE